MPATSKEESRDRSPVGRKVSDYGATVGDLRPARDNKIQ